MANLFDTMAGTPFDTLVDALRHPEASLSGQGPADRAGDLAIASWMAVIAELWHEAFDLASESQELASRTGDNAVLLVVNGLLATLELMHRGEQSNDDILDRVADLLTRADPPRSLAFASMLAIPNWFSFADRYHDAGRIVDRQILSARARSDTPAIIWSLACRADLDLRRGRWQRAASALGESLELSVVHTQPAGYLHVLAARLAAATGRFVDADVHVSAARASAFDLGDTSTLWRADAVEGFAMLSAGDSAGSARALRHLAVDLARRGHALASVRQWDADLVEALIGDGLRSDAATLVEELHDKKPATVWDDAARGRCVALISDQPELALEAALSSEQQFGQIGAPFEQARSQVIAGEIHLSLGRSHDARSLLSRVVSTCAALGAQPLADRARHGIGRCARPVVTSSTSWDARLTEQERSIARAVAAGSSNLEVAAEHFISAKTVEAHLTRIYRKLDLASRNQLAALAYRSQPAATR